MREIYEIRAGDLQAKNLRFRMEGSDHDYHVVCLDDEWNCDCMGFLTKKNCRHVKSRVHL